MTTAGSPAVLRRLVAIGTSRALSDFAAAPPAGIDVAAAASLAEAAAIFAGADPVDLLVVDAGELDAGLRPGLVALAARAAIVVVTPGPVAIDRALRWIEGGADDVLAPEQLLEASAGARLAFAVARRGQHGHDAAWATDLATGLPHRRQLIEHFSQLLALRERQPSPMAVLALRIEVGSGVDVELLRRKIAVRLRGSVRAGDIVASIDGESFCVLLATLIDGGDAIAVAAKLTALLVEPYAIGTHTAHIGVASGIAIHPADGDQADRLVRRALALAAAAPAVGSALRHGERVREAANDG